MTKFRLDVPTTSRTRCIAIALAGACVALTGLLGGQNAHGQQPVVSAAPQPPVMPTPEPEKVPPGEEERLIIWAFDDSPSLVVADGLTAGDSCSCESCESFWQRRRELADKHAPAGLMGDHFHEVGEWMFEYKFMQMNMDGNRAGTQRLSDTQALAFGQGLTPPTNVAATPTNMTMDMHMMHVMYGWTENINLYAMLMWSSFEMDHLRATPFPPNAALSGTPFTTQTDSFHDMTVGAVFRLYESDQDDLFFNLGFSLPTGDINNLTTVPTGGAVAQEFPYPMRHGSGTVNIRPSVTYKRFFHFGSFGTQFQTDLPLGKNWDDYSVSNEFRLNAWYSHLLSERFAMSFRVENLWKTNFDGADPDLNPALISTNRPDMRGGYWLNFGYGAMLLLGDGHLFNFEVVHPVYQDLDGIQLEQDWTLWASWSKAF